MRSDYPEVLLRKFEDDRSIDTNLSFVYKLVNLDGLTPRQTEAAMSQVSDCFWESIGEVDFESQKFTIENFRQTYVNFQ